jgi:opacity protein-like surface antigen
MTRLFAAILFASTAATVAHAADAVVYNPAPPAAPVTYQPEFRWTGPYIGGQLGYGWADTNVGVEGSGALGGVHAGYNYDLGGFVVGAEADYDFADIELDGDAGEVDGIARAKLRGGVNLGRVLPYLTGGAAHATADIEGEGDVSGFGYVLGGGADFALTDQVIVGGEYLYHDFSDIDDTGIDVEAHTVRAKASYKF